MRFTLEVREKIAERAEWRCERCGGAGYFQYHHRRARGAGGSRDPITGSPANGLLLHSSCHAHVESHRTEALENGWLVYQSHDPLKVPVKTWRGWKLLTIDGGSWSIESSGAPKIDKTINL